MANGKRRHRDSEDEEMNKEQIKKASMDSTNYDFFHDKPEGEQFNVFPQILEICASSFTQPQPRPQTEPKPPRWKHIERDNRIYVNLDELDIRGVQVFANWSMDHEKPTLIAINDNEGDILDDVIVCYLTARRLRAYLLCDLILFEACEIGKETELIAREDQIIKAPEDALRIFLATLVAYKRRNGLANLITGKDPRSDRQRARFNRLPEDFQFDLMNELSKNSAAQNQCYRPRRFLKVVAYHMQKKQEKRAAAERARLEARGSRESPLFVGEEDEE
ncbi:unnamed protein product [Aureobasidium mustum]|uniref:Uncharacterized protein n=1 Tax=Aureobasidium mustum TaxID=2773714 RepID=A0A9N8K0M6_9PEZI|nr:unnamed protein product [Aureobasidium mustum]